MSNIDARDVHPASTPRGYTHTYHDRLVYKVMNAEPPLTQRRPVVTFAQTLDTIRRVHAMTLGLPQIVYLTGWQYRGHDDKYPAFFEVNPALGEPGEDAREATVRLMEDARQYNAIVSVHINLCDAYEDSPLWAEYVAADVITRLADGSLSKGQLWGGKQSYHICKTLEWRSGLLRRRIDQLLERLPISDAGTIHVDVFNAKASPGHGVTLEDEWQTLREILGYFRQQDIDVTIEWWKRELSGLIPMVWHFNADEEDRLTYPPDVICGGGDAWNGRRDRPSGAPIGWMNANSPSTGCRYEEAWGRSVDREPYLTGDEFAVFARSVFERTLPWLLLYTQRPVRYGSDAETYTVDFTGGLRSKVRKADRHLTIADAAQTYVEGRDLVVPAPWHDPLTRIMFSGNGGHRTWQLGVPWIGRHEARLLRLWPDEEAVERNIIVDNGRIEFASAPGEAWAVRPLSG